MPLKTAKVFTHGNSQAVRLPKEFRFEDSEVIIRKVGESILLTPKKHRWKNLEAASAYSRERLNGISRQSER
jgi:virulence-associated protein VagC